MSNNSRHAAKMQKRFDKEETARRERAGLQTEAPKAETKSVEETEPRFDISAGLRA